MSQLIVRTSDTHWDCLFMICTNYSRDFSDFGGVLRTRALRRHKMAGPRLGVSPIALPTPLPLCTEPPVNVQRLSFSLLLPLSPSHIVRAVTSRPDAHCKNYVDYSFRCVFISRVWGVLLLCFGVLAVRIGLFLV